MFEIRPMMDLFRGDAPANCMMWKERYEQPRTRTNWSPPVPRIVSGPRQEDVEGAIVAMHYDPSVLVLGYGEAHYAPDSQVEGEGFWYMTVYLQMARTKDAQETREPGPVEGTDRQATAPGQSGGDASRG